MFSWEFEETSGMKWGNQNIKRKGIRARKLKQWFFCPFLVKLQKGNDGSVNKT